MRANWRPQIKSPKKFLGGISITFDPSDHYSYHLQILWLFRCLHGKIFFMHCCSTRLSGDWHNESQNRWVQGGGSQPEKVKCAFRLQDQSVRSAGVLITNDDGIYSRTSSAGMLLIGLLCEMSCAKERSFPFIGLSMLTVIYIQYVWKQKIPDASG